MNIIKHLGGIKSLACYRLLFPKNVNDYRRFVLRLKKGIRNAVRFYRAIISLDLVVYGIVLFVKK